MQTPVYLDTARIGLMSPSARRMHEAFAALACDSEAPLYFHSFVRDGHSAWPDWLRDKHPDLASWQGLKGLADSLRQLLGAKPHSGVLVASRSASLFELAIGELASRCDCLVTTDLLWPPYRKLLEGVCRRSRMQLAVARLRGHVRRASQPWLAAIVADLCQGSRPYGLVLPAVTHRGVRLPLQPLVEQLAAEAPPELIVVDAAQAVGQTAFSLSGMQRCVAVGGVHKWLGGHHPMGFLVETGSDLRIADATRLRDKLPNDPLLKLWLELMADAQLRHGETASLIPLLTSQGAINDALTTDTRQRLAVRLKNRRRTAKLLESAGWSQAVPIHSASHGILVTRPAETGRKSKGEHLHSLRSHGVAATSFPDGTTRFAMPDQPLGADVFENLRKAISADANVPEADRSTHGC